MSSGIKLLVSDVDGTLLTDDKQLAPGAAEAARKLARAGVTLALASARPPRGLESLARELGITSPVAAFNGGAMVTPGMRSLRRLSLWAADVEEAASVNRALGLATWLYSGSRWLADDTSAGRVEWEVKCVGFRPQVLHRGMSQGVQKVTCTCEDPGLMARAEKVMRRALPGAAVERSTPFYLDITHKDAHKGAALTWLAGYHGLDPSQVAAIGDGENDTRMFARAGLSVAMGNAGSDVQLAASHVTGGNNTGGWADAVEKFILA